jgi:hypothetical protein
MSGHLIGGHGQNCSRLDFRLENFPLRSNLSSGGAVFWKHFFGSETSEGSPIIPIERVLGCNHNSITRAVFIGRVRCLGLAYSLSFRIQSFPPVISRNPARSLCVFGCMYLDARISAFKGKGSMLHRLII